MKKRNFLYLCMTAIVAFAFCGCNDEEVLLDGLYGPVRLGIYVQDEAGNNLLDESVPNNILDTPIMMEFENNVHPRTDKSVIDFWSEYYDLLGKTPPIHYPTSTIYMNLALSTNIDEFGEPYLEFGDIDGNKIRKNEPLTIVWGDDTRDIIKWNRTFSGNSATDKFKLNGKKYDALQWRNTFQRRSVKKFVFVK